MTSASSPDPTPDLQPELQPKPQKPAPDLEFEELETALPALDVIPRPAPVVAPVVQPVAKAADPDELTPFPLDQVAPITDTATDTTAETTTETATADATSTVAAPAPDTSSLTDKLLVSFFKLWAKTVGEPADPNRAIIGLSVLSLTTLIVLSRIYGFIDQLPILAPVFELVGFFYSISVLIRYIRSKEDRSDLGKTVDDLKKKLLG
jgi:hypothetical protein